MIFRRAVLSDAPFVARLVREFYVGQDYNITYGIEFDYESTLATVTAIIERGVCILGPHSCAGAYVAPFPFNHTQRVAYVQFWFFNRKGEAAIFKKFLQALESEVHHVWAVSHPPHHRVGRLYRKLGFRQVEGVWSKRLTGP